MAAKLLVPLLTAALLAAPAFLSTYSRSLALAILADVALAVSWAFFSGPTRYLSLATGAFFGAGAYTTAVVGARLAWPLPVLAGAVVGAVLALVVGALALRLRGPYFAVFTFGLALFVQPHHRPERNLRTTRFDRLACARRGGVEVEHRDAVHDREDAAFAAKHAVLKLVSARLVEHRVHQLEPATAVRTPEEV